MALGRMYMTGDGVPANYTEALRWVRLAKAQANGGQGAPDNELAGKTWFHKATDWLQNVVHF